MSVPRWVAIDDTDPNIQYIGASWFQDQGSKDFIGDFGPAYQSTLHGTNTSASLSFPFNGTQVKVLGFNNIRNDSNVPDPTWDCFVDNAAIGKTVPSTTERNNWVFCQHDELYDGPHVLTVNATVAKGQTFWFDQIQYVPSSSDFFTDNTTILLDNMDGALRLGSAWGPFGDTANGTIVPKAFFSFSFVGSSLSWYGITPVDFPRSAATSHYIVDDDTPVIFTYQGLPSDATSTLYNQKLFETPQYPRGLHQIFVSHDGNSSTTPLTLDYLLVQNASSVLSVSPTFEYANSAADLSVSSSSDSYNIGKIAGLTTGMLLLVVPAIYAFFYLRRRNKRQNKAKPKHFNLYDGYNVEPFHHVPTSPPDATVHSQARITPVTPQTQRAPDKMHFQRRPIHNRYTTEHVRMALPSDLLPGRNLPPDVNNGESSQLMVHEDSGVRLRFSGPGSEGGVVEVPPMYTTG